MDEADVVVAARLALGQRLARLRRERSYTQHAFAPHTGYSRSILAEVERGRRINREFWVRCDKELDADGVLVDEYDRVEMQAAVAAAVIPDGEASTAEAAVHRCPNCHHQLSVITVIAAAYPGSEQGRPRGRGKG